MWDKTQKDEKVNKRIIKFVGIAILVLFVFLIILGRTGIISQENVAAFIGAFVYTLTKIGIPVGILYGIYWVFNKFYRLK